VSKNSTEFNEGATPNGAIGTEINIASNGSNSIKNSKSIDIWSKCLSFIKDNVAAQVFKIWFQPIQALEYSNKELTLSVPSQFYYEWIEEHYYDLMRATIKKIIGEGASLQYKIVFDDSLSHEKTYIKMPGLKKKASENQNHIPFEPISINKDNFPTNLNTRYGFDNFISGESNQLAYSAAKAVADNPGKTRFNPLVIYGGPGLGKTHLIQAIGNHITENNPRLKVYYITSDMFTNEFVNSIKDNKISDFVNFYRSIDVLMVDDIQFFAGKEATQNNFFHTFNTLYQAGKQIILTSDKAPRELADVDDRLISRFQWGLNADVQSPDFELRMAILLRKSLDEGIELTSDVIEYIARNVKTSVRELEGALIGLIAKVTLDRKPMTLELAKEVVYGSKTKNNQPITIDEIKNLVSEYYKLNIKDIESKSRKHEIALARQTCMYLAKKFTTSSLKTIGSHFGNRDHSTVLHSCQTIDNYIVTDKKVKNSIDTFMKQLKRES